MALATTNITTTIVRNALGESVNGVKTLCASSNLNEWSLHKPANYGAGKDAWTVDANSESGYAEPITISTDSSGYRLGDYRGYNHTANPPRYFANPTNVSVAKYEPFTENLSLFKGEMSETSTSDGFSTYYWDKFDGSSNALLGVKLFIDFSAYGNVVDITQSSTMNMPVSNLDSGSYRLDARYFDRGVYTEPWDLRNYIEGGHVTLNINTTAANFEITAIALTPTTVGPKAPQEPISEDFNCRITFHNSYGAQYVRTMYWTFEDSGDNVRQSGSFGINLTTGQTKYYDIVFSDTFDDIGTYTFKTRVFSTSGEVVDNGTDTTLVYEA